MKHFVLQGRFNPELLERISDIWELVSSCGLNISLKEDFGWPHLSFTSSEREHGVSNFEQLREIAAVPITVSSLATWGGKSPMIFLGVTPTRELLELHRILSEVVKAGGGANNSLNSVSSFVPHISIFPRRDLPEVQRVFETVVSEVELPLKGFITAIELVEYFPAKVLHECLLAGSGEA